MNDTNRQIIILIAVMALLTAITLFVFDNSELSEESKFPEIPSPSVESYSGPGAGLVNQSAEGLTLLYKDITSFAGDQESSG